MGPAGDAATAGAGLSAGCRANCIRDNGYGASRTESAEPRHEGEGGVSPAADDFHEEQTSFIGSAGPFVVPAGSFVPRPGDRFGCKGRFIEATGHLNGDETFINVPPGTANLGEGHSAESTSSLFGCEGCYNPPAGTSNLSRGTANVGTGHYFGPKGDFIDLKGSFVDPEGAFVDPKGSALLPRGHHFGRRGNINVRAGSTLGPAGTINRCEGY